MLSNTHVVLLKLLREYLHDLWIVNYISKRDFRNNYLIKIYFVKLKVEQNRIKIN